MKPLRSRWIPKKLLPYNRAPRILSFSATSFKKVAGALFRIKMTNKKKKVKTFGLNSGPPRIITSQDCCRNISIVTYQSSTMVKSGTTIER